MGKIIRLTTCIASSYLLFDKLNATGNNWAIAQIIFIGFLIYGIQWVYSK